VGLILFKSTQGHPIRFRPWKLRLRPQRKRHQPRKQRSRLLPSLS